MESALSNKKLSFKPQHTSAEIGMHAHTHTATITPLPLRLRLCWMVAWRGGGGGRGRGRDCRDAPMTFTRKGPGCGPPISSETE